MPKIDDLLRIVSNAGASDLHLSAGTVPMIRKNGSLSKTRHKSLSEENIRQLVYEILSDTQIRQFEKTGDLDFAHSVAGGGRFRVNLYRTHTGISAAIRTINSDIPDLLSLGFSQNICDLARSRSGLLLVTGPTNSGKSTTLAAMIDHINTHESRHVITLEDPIEYIHQNKNSLISQRQIGLHSSSFATALRAALREDPDVILVGEMRDTETISLAITAAEVGLLVLGTLHTSSAVSSIERITDVFPSDQQQQIRVMLADSLLGVISQQLLRLADGSGRIVAYELMIRSSSIQAMIREERTYQISTAIQTGRKKGMRLLDNHLKALVDSGKITPEEAIRVASDPSIFIEKTPSNDMEPAQL